MTSITSAEFRAGKGKAYQYAIGIDAGTNTGLAVWDCESKKLVAVISMPIHHALVFVEDYHDNAKIIVRVEDARQVKFKVQAVKAQGAGSVKRDASIWEDFLKDLNIPYEMVRPNKAITKWSAQQFKTRTGWTHSTNEHARDAAMLVYGY